MLFFRSKHTETMPDAELVGRYRKTGKPEYLGVLFSRYSQLVFGLCMKYLHDPETAKDMVMQIFESLTESLKAKEINSFSSWLYSVGRNQCLMYLRTNARRNAREEKFSYENSDTADSEDENVRQISDENLESAIESLNEKQKLCIRMFFFGEKSYRTISQETGFPENEIKSHIQNGKRNLKNILSRHDNTQQKS
ncbi:MAG: sigma-70 family RNA polymerase sigma factor [Bacteroidetes bacterium]|nr:sigma-70 family RNA polymerase sigma factor [Bacteroidota bacterium]MBU1718751.1 sigma-70 family RNA polymerase sigma factor [Bacteroidota bacterium]